MGNSVKRESFDLFNRVSDLVRHLPPRGKINLPIHDSLILAMYWRSLSLFRGVMTLLEKNLAEEALILGRSLFTESLWLMELSEAEAHRARLVLGWMRHSYEEIKGLFREAQRMGLDQNAGEVIAHYVSQQGKLQDYARRHGIGPFKKFRSQADAAKRFGRHDDYWTYLLSHEMVHGSDAAFVFRRRKINKDAFAVFSETTDPEIVEAVGAFAAKSLLAAAKATIHIFHWQQPAEIDILYQKLEALPALTGDPDKNGRFTN